MNINNLEINNQKLPEIYETYNGYNIREIRFNDPQHDRYNFGKLKHISDTSASLDPWIDEDFGIDIYQTNYDRKKALRVDNKINAINYMYYLGIYNEARFINKLQELQEKVKLTEFPTGVVTFGEAIIGQEIPYYDNYLTLLELTPNLTKDEVKSYLYQMMDIIEELSNNGIIYSDVHNRNFVINPETKDIKLIDFDETYVKFGDKTHCEYEAMFNHITKLLNYYYMLYNDDNKEIKNVDSIKKARQLILEI